MPYSYILPHPFDLEVEDYYLLGSLWLYLLGLLEAPSTTMDYKKRPTLAYLGLLHGLLMLIN
jgi:hypothetical protein